MRRRSGTVLCVRPLAVEQCLPQVEPWTPAMEHAQELVRWCLELQHANTMSMSSLRVWKDSTVGILDRLCMACSRSFSLAVQSMRGVCGFDERESSRNGFLLARRWHRAWDCGLWGLHPNDLTVKLGDTLKLHAAFAGLDGVAAACASAVLADTSRVAYSTGNLLCWRWHFYLQKNVDRRLQMTSQPYYCIICKH